MILFSFTIILVTALLTILLQAKADHGHGHGKNGPFSEFHPSKLETMISDEDLKPKPKWSFPDVKKAGGRVPGTYEAEHYKDPTKYGVKGIEHELTGARQRMPGPRDLKDKVYQLFANVRNMAVNAIDNTVGVPIAHVQNWKTKRYLAGHPNTKDPILYLMHGLAQNIGSQWRLASQARDRGFKPYHLKGKHHLGDTGAAEDAFHQIEELHRGTHLKDAYKRKDLFSGHSSGGNVGIEMAGYEQAKKLGIGHIQARAPTPHGFKKMRTIEQKAAGTILDIEGENIGTNKKAREAALRKYDRPSQVPVYIVAGREDALVPPDDTVYKHAKGYHILKHPAATHFGTSGVNKDVNKMTLDLLVNPSLYRPVDWYRPKPESVKEHKRDFFGRDAAAKAEMEKWNKQRAQYHGHGVGDHYHHNKPAKQYHGHAQEQHKAAGHH